MHCRAPLPLYRKLADDRFCSDAHRTAFHYEHAKLAIERLTEGHRNGPAAELRGAVAAVAIDDPQAGPELKSGSPGESVPPSPGLIVFSDLVPWPASADILAADPIAYDLGGEPRLPSTPVEAGTLQPCRASRVKIPVTASECRARPAHAAEHITRLAQLAAVLPSRPEMPMPKPAMPPPAELRPMPGLEAFKLAARHDIEPVELPQPGAWLPGTAAADGGFIAVPMEPGLVPLAAEGKQIAASETNAPLQVQAKPILKRKLLIRLPGPVFGTREAAQFPEPGCVKGAIRRPEAANALLELRLPLPEASRAPAAILPPRREPEAGTGVRLAGMIPLAYCDAAPPGPVVRLAGIGPEAALVEAARPKLAAQSSQTDLGMAGCVSIPLRAGTGLAFTPAAVRRAIQPADAFAAKPAVPWVRRAPQPIEAYEIQAAAANARAAARAWSLASLRQAPASVRLMLIAVPVLALIALRPAGEPPVPGTEKSDNVRNFMNAKVDAVRTVIQNRAGVELLDDFRSGLDNWESKADLTRTWTYDQTGFVKPGPLAVFKPSMGMSDYDLEFLGQIDRRSLGWVFRAEDLNNYHVAKIVVLQGGPLPRVGLERYTVRNGREGSHSVVMLPLNVRKDTIYRVRLEARGPDFSLYVQNQMVQFWSDRRFPQGGVGFLAGAGEQSRVRWLQVSHQYDVIGRLCAYFAPMAVVTYNLEPTIGAGTK